MQPSLPIGSPAVPGRVATRINLERGAWRHVTERHFDPSKNASQFSIGQAELRTLLQSERVIHAPIARTAESFGAGTIYVREVNVGRVIGMDKFNGFRPTSSITVMTNRYGNLITTHPGLMR